MLETLSHIIAQEGYLHMCAEESFQWYMNHHDAIQITL